MYDFYSETNTDCDCSAAARSFRALVTKQTALLRPCYDVEDIALRHFSISIHINQFYPAEMRRNTGACDSRLNAYGN